MSDAEALGQHVCLHMQGRSPVLSILLTRHDLRQEGTLLTGRKMFPLRPPTPADTPPQVPGPPGGLVVEVVLSASAPPRRVSPPGAVGPAAVTGEAAENAPYGACHRVIPSPAELRPL